MRPPRPALLALAAVLTAAACAGGDEPAGQSPGTAFTRALATEYGALAQAGPSGTPEADSRFFAKRAERAESGETLAPQTLYDLAIPPDRVLDLADARIRLIGALRDNARLRAPELAARAQTRFDCWTIKTARDRAETAPDPCRDAFQQAMTALNAELGQESGNDGDQNGAET